MNYVSWLGRVFAISVPVVLGVCLVYLSVPRFMSALTELSQRSVWEKLVRGEGLTSDQKVGLFSGLEDQINWLPSGDAYYRKARAEIAMAQRASYARQKENWYNRAEQSIEEALLRRPSDPYAWSRLAFLRSNLGGASIGTIVALEMSYATGLYEPPLVAERISLGLRMWDKLDESMRTTVKNQIVWLDRLDRKELIMMARQNRAHMKVIVNAMASDLPRFKTFIKNLNR